MLIVRKEIPRDTFGGAVSCKKVGGRSRQREDSLSSKKEQHEPTNLHSSLPGECFGESDVGCPPPYVGGYTENEGSVLEMAAEAGWAHAGVMAEEVAEIEFAGEAELSGDVLDG